mmetsp:Transcript_118575/g.382830  ORF Transcript_118575/g.382830 Transcript_118575/m.382830 type:complete len:232 (+) Transcript_118575:75-770(+)
MGPVSLGQDHLQNPIAQNPHAVLRPHLAVQLCVHHRRVLDLNLERLHAEVNFHVLRVLFLEPRFLEGELDVFLLLHPSHLFPPLAGCPDVHTSLGADHDKLLGLPPLCVALLLCRHRLLRQVQGLKHGALLFEGLCEPLNAPRADRVALHIQRPEHRHGSARRVDCVGKALCTVVVHVVETEVQLPQLAVPLEAVSKQCCALRGDLVAPQVQQRKRSVGVKHGRKPVNALV